MPEQVRRVGALAWFNVLQRLRDPGHLISYTVMPMVLMLVFRPLFVQAVNGGVEQVVTGMLVMFSVLALAIVGTSIVTERAWHTWDRLRATPASSFEIVVGKAVPVLLILLLQQTVLLVFGVTVVGLHVTGPLWLIAVVMLAWSFALLSIGSMLAAYVRSHGELAAACDVGGLAVSTMGGTLVPVAMMPLWAQKVAPASPGYWALQGLRSAVRNDVYTALVAAAVLVVIGLVAGTIACQRLSRGWARSSLL
jgi:ABC-2 type transport system permease protein